MTTEGKRRSKKPETKSSENNGSLTDGNVSLEDAAVKNEVSVHSSILAVPLRRIVDNINPRQEPAKLCALGYSLIDLNDTSKSIIHMVLHDDIDVVREIVKLFEEHENFVPETESKEDEEDFQESFGDDTRMVQSIVALAGDIKSTRQIQPVGVEWISGKAGNVRLRFGQRRTAAICYLHAKSRCELADETKGAKFFPPVVQATIVPKESSSIESIIENLSRKDFTHLQLGYVIKELMQQTNPVTGKKHNLRQVAAILKNINPKFKYGIVRNRYALTMKRREAVVDERGIIIKRAQGLTDAQRMLLESGKLKLTTATSIALGEINSVGESEGKKGRDKPMPIKKMQELFDATPSKNVERRKALAECMQIPYEKACKQSNLRIARHDAQMMRELGDK